MPFILNCDEGIDHTSPCMWRVASSWEATIAGPKAKPGIDRIRAHMLGSADDGLPPPWALLNSNESVFGPSRRARDAARASVSGIERYPEGVEATLARAIAGFHKLDPERMVVGQGADDLLSRLFRAYLGQGGQLVRSANGYLKVPNYAHANGGEVVSVEDDDLTPSVDGMIAAVTERTRVVYLANPENPAGTYLPRTEVERLHAALPDDVLLILDCAYAEYAWADDYCAGHDLVARSANVVVCRTFSKIYGLAGARVGWAHGPRDVVDAIRRIGLTFPMAAPSVAAAVAALEDQAHVAFVRRENRALLDRFRARLARLGVDCVPSQTNFVLVRMPEAAQSDSAVVALGEAGIRVRRMNAPAYANCFRVSIGLGHELDATARALERHLGAAKSATPP